jgi:hypothetical protein
MTRSHGSSGPGDSGWQWGRRGAIALCAAAVAIGAAACGGSDSPAPAASSTAAAASPAAGGLAHFPAQLFGLNKNTSQTAQALGRVFANGFAVAPSEFRGAQSAVYGSLSGPAVVLFAASWAGTAARKAASAAFDKATAASGAKGSGSTDAQPFPAGPHGGSLECGHLHRNGLSAKVCVWADKVTTGGAIYTLGTASSLSDAASKTNQARSMIEP